MSKNSLAPSGPDSIDDARVPSTEDDEAALELMLELFGWDATVESRHAALVILRRARGLPAPAMDDYRAGIRR